MNGPDGDTSRMIWPSEAFLFVLKLGKEVAGEVSFILLELSVRSSKFFNHPVIEVGIDECRTA